MRRPQRAEVKITSASEGFVGSFYLPNELALEEGKAGQGFGGRDVIGEANPILLGALSEDDEYGYEAERLGSAFGKEGHPILLGALSGALGIKERVKSRVPRKILSKKQAEIHTKRAAKKIKAWAQNNRIPVSEKAWAGLDATAYGWVLELPSQNDRIQAAQAASKIALRHRVFYKFMPHNFLEGWYVVYFTDDPGAVAVATVDGEGSAGIHVGELRSLISSLSERKAARLEKRITRLTKRLERLRDKYDKLMEDQDDGSEGVVIGALGMGRPGGFFRPGGGGGRVRIFGRGRRRGRRRRPMQRQRTTGDYSSPYDYNPYDIYEDGGEYMDEDYGYPASSMPYYASGVDANLVGRLRGADVQIPVFGN